MAAPSGLGAREQWLGRVRAVLKDRPFETLASRTVEGLVIQPLYVPSDAPARAAPLRRAPRPEGELAWDVRAAVAHPDPAVANDHVLEALAGGASSVLLTLDPTGAMAASLARALDGVEFESAAVALDAGFAGPQAAQWLSDAAKGSPAARLAFHLDPIGAFARTGGSPEPIEQHIALAAETAARLATPHPAAGLMLASGRVVHEAGGSAGLELGFMAACAVAYARALTAAGLPLGQAFAGVTLGLSADGEQMTALAKVRAAREIWARVTAACGVSVSARIEARSSRRMLGAVDPWTNLLRLTAAGFGAAAGGADAIVLDGFSDALGPPAALARRLSRNIQLLLMEESHLGKVEDPGAGSGFVEALTRGLALEGWRRFQAIEAKGGVVQALIAGDISREVADVRNAREAAVADGVTAILGVTHFPDPDPRPVDVDKTALPSPVRRSKNPASSLCPPLEPMRLAEAAELVAADLEP